MSKKNQELRAARAAEVLREHERQQRRRQILSVVGVVGAGSAALAVTMPSGVDGPGAVLAELQGHTATSDHHTAEAAPRSDVPGWTRAVGSDAGTVRMVSDPSSIRSTDTSVCTISCPYAPTV